MILGCCLGLKNLAGQLPCLPKRRKAASYLCSWLLVLFGNLSALPVWAADLPILKMGFYLPTIRDANPADVKVGLQIWAEELGKSYGYRVSTSTYTDMGSLRAAVSLENLQMVNAAGMELAEFFQPNEIQGGYAKRTHGVDEGVVLVVAQGSSIRNFSDLRGKRLLRLGQDRLSEIYIETQCLKAVHMACNDFLTLVDERRELQLAYGVFFGKADAALLTMSALHTAGELNPQVLAKLRIVQSWKTTAFTFGLLTSQADQKLKKALLTSDVSAPGNARVRQMLDLFRTDYLMPVGPEALEPYWALLQEYRSLEKLSKGKRK